MSNETFSLEIDEIVAETDAAIKILTLEGEEIWLPLSQVHEIHRGSEPAIVMSAWIARQKGLL